MSLNTAIDFLGFANTDPAFTCAMRDLFYAAYTPLHDAEDSGSSIADGKFQCSGTLNGVRYAITVEERETPRNVEPERSTHHWQLLQECRELSPAILLSLLKYITETDWKIVYFNYLGNPGNSAQVFTLTRDGHHCELVVLEADRETD
jgi:hypothetical protein